MEFLKATQQHDDILIEHCLAVWDSYATPAAHFNVDPKGKVRQFVSEGRDHRELATFLAMDGNTAAGFVSRQVHMLPYPTCSNRQFTSMVTSGASSSSRTPAPRDIAAIDTACRRLPSVDWLYGSRVTCLECRRAGLCVSRIQAGQGNEAYVQLAAIPRYRGVHSGETAKLMPEGSVKGQGYLEMTGYE